MVVVVGHELESTMTMIHIHQNVSLKWRTLNLLDSTEFTLHVPFYSI